MERAFCPRAIGLLSLLLLGSRALADAPAERIVFTSPDGFVTVVTDTELDPAEAERFAQRIAAAYTFDRQEDRWADQKLLDPPILVRVLKEAPEGLLGRANAPKTFLIGLDYFRKPGSEATIAHELTHLQDFRQLRRKPLPQYWLEGRANSNAFAYRAHLGMQQNPDWKRRLARWTSTDARSLFAGTATGKDAHALVEEVGTLWFEHLRRRFPDAHPRSAKLIAAIATGVALPQAYQAAFGEPLEQSQAEFLAYLDATQRDPDARVVGTWMEWSTAGRVQRVRAKRGLSAVVEWSNGKAYVFRGGQYSRFDINSDRLDPGFPRPMRGNWPGFPWVDGFDAAANWGNGKVYFWKGDQYLRYDIATSTVDPGYPKRMMKENWAIPWIDGFDAAASWGDRKVYFFKDGEYLIYDLKQSRVEAGFPRPLDQGFPGMPFSRGVDAAVNLGRGKAYFFLGDRYLRYDVATNRTDPGFPQSLDGRW